MSTGVPGRGMVVQGDSAANRAAASSASWMPFRTPAEAAMP
jgi:hypothetical protein